MSDDLVKRLRNHIAVVIDNRGHVFEAETLCDEAADRIEGLEANLAKAVEALKHAEKYGDVETSAWAYDTLAELEGETNE